MREITTFAVIVGIRMKTGTLEATATDELSGTPTTAPEATETLVSTDTPAPQQPTQPPAQQQPVPTQPPPAANCDPSYPDFCLEPGVGDTLNCGDIPYRRFTVYPPDRHGFDRDGNGVGCESD